MTDEPPENASPAQLAPSSTPLAAATVGRLPDSVTAAAVILLVFGTLAALGSVLMLLAMVTLSAIPADVYGPMNGTHGMNVTYGGQNLSAFMWMGFAFIGAIVLLGGTVAAGHITAGVAILRRRAWGRILGLVVSGVAVAFLLLTLASSLMTATVPMPTGFDFPGYSRDWYASMISASILVSLLFVGLIGAAYGFVIWALARHAEAFD